jgi:hypothetical protein
MEALLHVRHNCPRVTKSGYIHTGKSGRNEAKVGIHSLQDTSSTEPISNRAVVIKDKGKTNGSTSIMLVPGLHTLPRLPY